MTKKKGQGEGPDLYVFTDAKGDTIIGTQDVIPWPVMDEFLREHYPLKFAQETESAAGEDTEGA